MSEVKTALIALVGAGLLLSILLDFLKDGAVKQAVQLVGGLLLILLVLAPLTQFDLDAFGQYLTEIQMERDMLETGIPVENEKILAGIIQEKTEAYILDKASTLGAKITVAVTVAAGEAYPYPNEVVIVGTLTAQQQETLTSWLAENLAIPKERQVFQTEETAGTTDPCGEDAAAIPMGPADPDAGCDSVAGAGAEDGAAADNG